MKACSQFEEMLMDAAAGAAETVPPELASHFSHCGGCIERFAQERQLFAAIDEGLAAAVAAEPSPEFARHVLEQVSGEAERKLLAAIDAGIAQSVEGEPSPRFAAAMRNRIATEPPPRRNWLSTNWWIPAAGLVAAAALLAVMLKGTPTVSVPQDNLPLNSASAQRPIPPAGIDAASAQTPRLQPAAKHRSSRSPAARPSGIVAEAAKLDTPEVLIAADELQVITRFYRFVQEGRINAAQVLEGNRIELAARLAELKTPVLVAQNIPVKTLDLVDAPRSTSDEK